MPPRKTWLNGAASMIQLARETQRFPPVGVGELRSIGTPGRGNVFLEKEEEKGDGIPQIRIG